MDIYSIYGVFIHNTLHVEHFSKHRDTKYNYYHHYRKAPARQPALDLNPATFSCDVPVLTNAQLCANYYMTIIEKHNFNNK